MTIPAAATQFIDGVLKGIGAPVNATTVKAFTDWLANEQGGPDLTDFDTDKGNPLGIQTPAAQNSGKEGNLQTGIGLTVTELKNYPEIENAFKTGTSTDDIATQIVNSPWNTGKSGGSGYGGLAKFNAVASGTSDTTGEPGAVTIPSQPQAQPIAGANVKNFYGYDLTPWANSPELGTMENAIKNYVVDPGYKAQIDQKLTTEYGYQTNWWKSIPEVNAVMIYAATSLDPSNATQQNEFQSLLANTSWWQTTTSNGRYWDEAYGTNGSPGTDPAQAQQALQNAQEKVLADANQIGVSLSKQQLDAIALTYAKNNYVASGSFGTASGTAAEWLDQAIVDTLENIQGQNVGKIPTDFSTLAPGTSDFTTIANGAQASASTATPTGLTGISSQLYSAFQNIAQQYLMYNPTNPAGSLLTNQQLMQQVESTLQNYTGSGSSFGSSNLISGAEAQFTQQMMQQASQLYPGMAASIAAGTTPQAYAAPYSSVISQMTGIDPASINYTDPQWNWVIATPNAQGVKSPLTLDQVQQKLATTPQFDQSNNAAQMADSVTSSLSSMMGFGGK
jgi:hypothetical protein